MADVNPSSSSPPKTAGAPAKAKYCMCAPTTHPGSFRCRLHRSAAATAPPESEEESKMDAAEATTAAAAAAVPPVRAFLARASRNSSQDVGRIRCFRPRASRLGITEE
ncbi:hypothetical protein ABZP36_022401 [Zizania latifolia]